MTSLIAAYARNRVIGLENGLPWHLPHDLRRFKRLTMGHPMILGRKTYDSIGNKPLPGRRMIVVTRARNYASPGVLVAHSIPEALGLVGSQEEVFVAGGEEIYRQTLPLADRLYLTILDRDYPGDAFFPEFDKGEWNVVEDERHPAAPPAPAFRYLTLARK